MRNKLLLSVFILTYNHEKFIREALDSVLNQVTSFDFEIIIGDDASTDKTPDILKEYQTKYSDRIKLFLRKKNLGGKGANNLLDLVKRCTGKYVIALEGDDYWIDKYKLERQVNFLERHPEYIGVAHKCVVVDEISHPNGEQYPECIDKIYTIKHLASNIMPGQFTTLMYRNIYCDSKVDYTLLEQGLLPADRLICFILLSYGSIYCMNEVASAYRHITSSGTSFSANVNWKYEEARKWNKSIVQYSKRIGNKESLKYAQLMLMKTIIGSRKRDNIRWKMILHDLFEEKIPLLRYFQYASQIVRRVVLKKVVWA